MHQRAQPGEQSRILLSAAVGIAVNEQRPRLVAHAVDDDAVHGSLGQAGRGGEILGQLRSADIEHEDLQRFVELQRANQPIKTVPGRFHGLKAGIVQHSAHELTGHAVDPGDQIRLPWVGLAHDVRRDRFADQFDDGGRFAGARPRGPVRHRRRGRDRRPATGARRIPRGQGPKALLVEDHGRRQRKGLRILQLSAQLAHGREELQRGEQAVRVKILEIANGNRERRLVAQLDLDARRDLTEQGRKAVQVNPLWSQLSARPYLGAAGMPAEVAQHQHAHRRVRTSIGLGLLAFAKSEIHLDASTRSIGHGLLRPAG